MVIQNLGTAHALDFIEIEISQTNIWTLTCPCWFVDDVHYLEFMSSTPIPVHCVQLVCQAPLVHDVPALSCSNEAGRGARKASVDKTPWPTVVCTALMCYNWWWTLWGLDVAYIKSQEQIDTVISEHIAFEVISIRYFVCTRLWFLSVSHSHVLYTGSLFLSIFVWKNNAHSADTMWNSTELGASSCGLSYSWLYSHQILYTLFKLGYFLLSLRQSC